MFQQLMIVRAERGERLLSFTGGEARAVALPGVLAIGFDLPFGCNVETDKEWIGEQIAGS